MRLRHVAWMDKTFTGQDTVRNTNIEAVSLRLSLLDSMPVLIFYFAISNLWN